MSADSKPSGLPVRVAARFEQGRDERTSVPLESHADLIGDARPSAVATLVEQDEHRLPDLVPIRHGRMSASAFTFYRGAAAVMASDLARLPATDLRVQLCGDAHLSNFGVFNGADRRLVFDLNDFDETLPGPFEWDLKRLAASVTIAGRNNELDARHIRSATRAAVKGYRETLHQALPLSPLDVHYLRIEIESLLADHEKPNKKLRKSLEKATRKDSVRALEKLTETIDGVPRIIANPPLIEPLRATVDEGDIERVRTFFHGYRESLAPHRAAVLDRYRIIDLARKVVGVGSVGTRCLILLLASDQDAPLFLQFKEAGPSVLEPHLGTSEFELAGERVVRGQRLLQATGDILLGWSRLDDVGGRSVDFYFRQMWDGKGSAEIDDMGPKRLKNYAWHCGAALALAHARTGDGPAIAGYLGDDRTADDVFADFAERYADLNESDHAEHQQAIESGALAAVTGE